MRAIDIIYKTKHKIELSEEEIKFLINGYVKGDIPDYQMSAWTMAVYFNSLTEKETYYLTKAMIDSGDRIDMSSIDGYKVDKHSTGGVGDKTSLVLGPIAAACGCVMPKLSGRGLGHTGGTLDKLESIPGVTISLPTERFRDQVNNIHLAIAGQTANLVPADKLLYALRDVTETVDSLPLIASSIMSKKLASGADLICIDVKFGSGAFMKTKEDAIALSREMIKLAKNDGRKCICFITDMSSPLGHAIGNRLEVMEAYNTLKGKGPKDLEELCLTIASHMIYESKLSASLEEGLKMAEDSIKSGKALEKFKELITSQGATTTDIDNLLENYEIVPLKATSSGYIKSIDALTLGLCSMRLGAGREKKEDSIDPSVGLVLCKEIGDFVNVGDTLLNIYKSDKWDDQIISDLLNAYTLSKDLVPKKTVIHEIIG